MKSPLTKLGRVNQVKVLILAVFVLILTSFTVFSPAMLRAQNETRQAQVAQSRPVRITMPSVGIDLPVIESGYDTATGEWQISKTSAHWANTTEKLNVNSGNTLIYAHNQQGLFADTYNLKPGDTIEVVGEDGKKFVYEYKYDWLTQPTDGSIFGYSGPAQLTLLCCNGENNERRRLMNFELKSVSQ